MFAYSLVGNILAGAVQNCLPQACGDEVKLVIGHQRGRVTINVRKVASRVGTPGEIHTGGGLLKSRCKAIRYMERL